MTKYLSVLICFLSLSAIAQNNTSYWQQHVDYNMDIDMDVETFQYKGTQKLEYTNNSPDDLNRVFYHLYFNAFQPGSEMDVRLQNIQDPDGRMTTEDKKSRIMSLSESEMGYIKVKSLTQDGKEVTYKTVGTVLEVELATPIKSGDKATFEMEFDGQVPQQIRRSGRNNAEGVSLSMTQWYPKMAEYDFEGWHADPYIGREFHGVWGDFNVNITIDKDYIIGGTGYLQNPEDIGYNYGDEGPKGKKGKKGKLTWKFKAPMVHDFTWAADPDYIHDKVTANDGTVLHFLYQDNDRIKENWKNLQPKTEQILEFFNENIGPYPYEQYSVIQGGDGGMEYGMSTLITGERKFGSLVGVTAHEMAHSWFQFILATNEAQHEWMDEGFTSFISSEAMNVVMGENKENPHSGSYRGYTYLANSGVEQPMTTHADRYNVNQAYSITAYAKGAVFLAQLEYLLGNDLQDEIIKEYYNQWKFKHPTPNDFIRVAEKVSGAELGWYLIDFGQTTNTIDYAVKTIEGNTATLERIGLMPMPIDAKVTFADGTTKMVHIPLRMMRWVKPNAENVQEDWPWAMPTYELKMDKEISKVEIDPSQLMADVKRDNNTMQK
ncbi:MULTISPECIES: M1 family metallopeptidase [Croceibacter]|uniref:M1 family metallopeptidase n=1 Tax=Croceibacter TaxID=216431 RepID=UPI000C6437C8|nr:MULTISPECIES: M1 family metallopeptidase [Croceibacter]MBG25260.1 peptidase M1 [Croceibacter sp.]|tara:strand:- start:1139 stop:2950 length:1812 start_codon:yes stop_codon:yes gene_type:complete